MNQNDAINVMFNLAETAQTRGAWSLEEAHTIWEARLAFLNPPQPEIVEPPEPPPIPEPELEENIDETAAE